MNSFLLHLHGGLRWLILLSLLVVLTKYMVGWLAKKPWTKTDNTLGIIFTSLMDLQLLTGLILYFFISPFTQAALNDFGAAIKDPILRFYAVEHLTIMLVAIVFVHIGRLRSKKVKTDRAKFQKSLFWFGLATLFIVAGIPWDRI